VNLQTEKNDATTATVATPAKGVKVEMKAEILADGLGRVGPILSSYHVGDLAGLVGLLLTWLTYRQAKAAKAAAQRAATAAIKNRDQLELATRLAELSGKLRTIRDVYRTDDWSSLEISKDHAVAIAVEVKAIEANNDELVRIMVEVEQLLREVDPRLENIKDENKRHGVKMKLGQRTNKLADNVDAMRLRKVKNGN
jgi:hypothetical protein